MAEFFRSKQYFFAMLESRWIFDKLHKHGLKEIIHHGAGQAYYTGLLKMDSPSHLKALQAMAERRAPEAEFVKALKLAGVVVSDDIVQSAHPSPSPTIAITDGEDVETIVNQILTGVPELMIDISGTRNVEFPLPGASNVNLFRPRAVAGGKGKGNGRGRGRGRGRGAIAAEAAGHRIAVSVHFDNCSHPSGKQRAFIGCPRQDHNHCYRWKNVELCPTTDRIIAELTAWAQLGVQNGAEYSKDDHIRDFPLESNVVACEARLTVGLIRVFNCFDSI